MRPLTRDWSGVQTRYRVGRDTDYQHDESDGGSMPMTPERYQGNEYQGCPDHPRAGTKVLDEGGDGRPQIQGCAECGRTDYTSIPYDEYTDYYGNPDRHVVLFVIREDRCPCCHSWVEGGSLWGIDCMDDSPEAQFDADPQGVAWTLDELPNYLHEVASGLGRRRGDDGDEETETETIDRAADRVVDLAMGYIRPDLATPEREAAREAIQDTVDALIDALRTGGVKLTAYKTETQPLTQLPFEGDDFRHAERMARFLGYEQTVYTSTSALWGLFCLRENPEHHPHHRAKMNGCIIKTRELGFLYVVIEEDVRIPHYFGGCDGCGHPFHQHHLHPSGVYRCVYHGCGCETTEGGD